MWDKKASYGDIQAVSTVRFAVFIGQKATFVLHFSKVMVCTIIDSAPNIGIYKRCCGKRMFWGVKHTIFMWEKGEAIEEYISTFRGVKVPSYWR